MLNDAEISMDFGLKSNNISYMKIISAAFIGINLLMLASMTFAQRAKPLEPHNREFVINTFMLQCYIERTAPDYGKITWLSNVMERSYAIATPGADRINVIMTELAIFKENVLRELDSSGVPESLRCNYRESSATSQKSVDLRWETYNDDINEIKSQEENKMIDGVKRNFVHIVEWSD